MFEIQPKMRLEVKYFDCLINARGLLYPQLRKSFQFFLRIVNPKMIKSILS